MAYRLLPTDDLTRQELELFSGFCNASFAAITVMPVREC